MFSLDFFILLDEVLSLRIQPSKAIECLGLLTCSLSSLWFLLTLMNNELVHRIHPSYLVI